ncbi:MAG: transcription elongation factor GreB [Burkholderiales bacterium]|jgi:transcription elongation factor GreB|nr:transcription elongation factor GreB [Burkholderiales bacterium]
MNKAFTRETDEPDDDEVENAPLMPVDQPNYMTPAGFERMKSELDHLNIKERPLVVQTVSWAAGNGDRSENGDYIYGKRRLREIDRRIRFLIKRLDKAVVVDPAARREDESRVYFGATVTFCRDNGDTQTVSIVGIDELDPARGLISWISPMARALLRAKIGDTVWLQTPTGKEAIEILEVRYEPIG